MKISRKWLQAYVDLSERSDDEISYALTMLGFEVESIESTGLPQLECVVVGEIQSFEKHPDADKLSVCQVDVGDGTSRNIVCGAKNFVQNDRVLVALPGAVLPGDFKIKEGKLRGVVSQGMMCSERELGLGDEHAGIAILKARPELGTPVNSVYQDAGDTVLDLEITPNRPDALSHVGIARELAAWYRTGLVYADVTLPVGDESSSSLIDSLVVEDPERCPHYLGYSIRGVKVGESPAWLKDALLAVGLRPINNIVDVTNFVLHELGQPLHAFDANKIGGKTIIVRAAKEGEKIVTLDDKERKLEPYMTVIADAEKPLVIAGVMGSVDAEVDESTVDVFLESAWFDPAMTRRTSRALILSTDSSYRFERRVDPLLQDKAAARCIQLILETAGGQLSMNSVVAGEPPATTTVVELKPAFVRERFGFDVSNEVIRDALSALECVVDGDVAASDDVALFRVTIPSWRGDLHRPVDLVEEVIRIYGCDQIPEGEVRSRGLISEDHPIPDYLRRASTSLVGKGFNETMHYSLRKADEFERWFPAEKASSLALQNPLASDASHLRSSLLMGLLDCVKLNQSRLNHPHRLFETGRVFREFNGKTIELVSVAFVMCRSTGQQWREGETVDYYSVAAVISELGVLGGLKAEPAGFEAINENPLWQTGQAALWGDLRRGYEAQFGLLSPELTREWDIDGLVVGGSFCFTPKFLQKARKRKNYSALSVFPPASRDLALLVDASEPSGKVRVALEKLAQSSTPKDFEMERCGVFDVYLGQGLPEGKKSIAFSLSYRASDRTLKDKEVNKAFEELQVSIAKKTSYAVRA
tara:strand:+ start:78625 stop:81072 length:2448 start_codon:yes stop_codon:yes gene_type:complete